MCTRWWSIFTTEVLKCLDALAELFRFLELICFVRFFPPFFKLVLFILLFYCKKYCLQSKVTCWICHVRQEKQRGTFFSIFYLSINAGSLLSTIITPILKGKSTVIVGSQILHILCITSSYVVFNHVFCGSQSRNVVFTASSSATRWPLVSLLLSWWSLWVRFQTQLVPMVT